MGAMLSMFAMIPEDYIAAYADAMSRVLPDGWGWLGILFNASWFFVGVQISYNIFASFTITIFSAMQSQKKDEEDGVKSEVDANLEKIKESLELQHKVLHMRIPAEVQRAAMNFSAFGDLQQSVKDAQDKA